jgi:serine/threonine protein kinase
MPNAELTHPFPLRLPNPAAPLRDALVRLNICRERDFRRCRGRVRRLARGIPAFDFIWIDALLSAGILTPFQAKILESSSPDQLRIGPCVLLDRLGRGEASETYLAITPGGADKLVLKRIRPEPELAATLRDRLSNLIERLRGLDTPYLVGPNFTDQHQDDLILLSRHAAGPNFRELMVRRGRFPVDVVAHIARQLSLGLAALESCDCRHGQIQLVNVRLTATGQAILVDAGVGAAVERGVLVRSDVPPEIYEGTAPELIGTGSPKTTKSELYAFGCLLWHLLAGRPPFPTGDPLAKLAAHQSRAIPDIREFAPDTHPQLAAAIRALTQRAPHERPTSFGEVAARFGNANETGHRRLTSFRRQFDTAAPLERTTDERRARWPAAAGLSALIVVAIGALMWSGTSKSIRTVGLRSTISAFLTQAPRRPEEVPRARTDHAFDTNSTTVPRSKPLPKPNADGVIVLESGCYEGQPIAFVGDLVIRGVAPSSSAIVVRARSFNVVCRKFKMVNVVLQGQTPSSSAKDACEPLLAIRSQNVSLERCTFATVGSDGTSSHAVVGREIATEDRSAVVWDGLQARDPDAGRIQISNTLFLNAGPAIVCASPPTRLEVDNCLKIGGDLFDLREWSAARDVAISARHLTLRHAEALCRVRIAKTTSRGAQLRAALDDCVFDLTGPHAALLLLSSEQARARIDLPFVVTGSGSVIRPSVPVVSQHPRGTSERAAANLSIALVEGLTAGEFLFVGDADSSAHNSAIDGRSLQTPRRSDVSPGIIAKRFAVVPLLAPADIENRRGPRSLAN